MEKVWKCGVCVCVEGGEEGRRGVDVGVGVERVCVCGEVGVCVFVERGVGVSVCVERCVFVCVERCVFVCVERCVCVWRGVCVCGEGVWREGCGEMGVERGVEWEGVGRCVEGCVFCVCVCVLCVCFSCGWGGEECRGFWEGCLFLCEGVVGDVLFVGGWTCAFGCVREEVPFRW